MYQNKKIIAYIPARAGSKGLVCKNKREVAEMPLFMHSVEYAFKSLYIDDVLVSSDDPEILKTAHDRGCVINNLRPPELSSDTARNIDGIIYELSLLKQKYDAVVLLQPTYPVRPPAAVLDEMIGKYFAKETSLVTVVESLCQPEFIRSVDQCGKLQKIMQESTDIRRQNFKKYYRIIGSVYINNAHKISTDTILNENEIPFILDQKYALDIDTEKDWQILENMIK